MSVDRAHVVVVGDDGGAPGGVDPVVVLRQVEQVVPDHARRRALAVQVDVVVVARLALEVAVLDEDVGVPRVDALPDAQELAVAEVGRAAPG